MTGGAPRPIRIALLASLVVLAFGFGGCTDSSSRDEVSADDSRAKEEAQTHRNSIAALRSYCSDRPWIRRNAPGPPRRTTRREAERAVGNLIREAKRYVDAELAANNDARQMLIDLATNLEQAGCLPGQVARIDRSLRLMLLPEYEETQPPPDEQQDPDFGRP
jgi:hypothetical protein